MEGEEGDIVDLDAQLPHIENLELLDNDDQEAANAAPDDPAPAQDEHLEVEEQQLELEEVELANDAVPAPAAMNHLPIPALPIGKFILILSSAILLYYMNC